MKSTSKTSELNVRVTRSSLPVRFLHPRHSLRPVEFQRHDLKDSQWGLSEEGWDAKQVANKINQTQEFCQSLWPKLGVKEEKRSCEHGAPILRFRLARSITRDATLEPKLVPNHLQALTQLEVSTAVTGERRDRQQVWHIQATHPPPNVLISYTKGQLLIRWKRMMLPNLASVQIWAYILCLHD